MPRSLRNASDEDPVTRRERARQLRHDQTTPEAVLWSKLRNRRLDGLKFRRQHPLGPWIDDFYCDEARLVVELDGSTHAHRRDLDRARDAWMHAQGLHVLRFRVGYFTTHPERVLHEIEQTARARRSDPPPSPAPGGRGQG